MVTVVPAFPDAGLTAVMTVGVFAPEPVSCTFRKYRPTEVGRDEKK